MKKQDKRYYRYILAIVWILILVFFDQFTKYLAIGRLKGKQPYVLVENVFQLEYLENRGAAFGLFQNQRVFFLASAILICIVVFWFYFRVPMERRFLPLRICAVLVVSGAVGNCIDRIRLNYVVDFLYFKLINFPIFNVADIYVTVSAVSLVLLMCMYYKEEDFERILHNGK